MTSSLIPRPAALPADKPWPPTPAHTTTLTGLGLLSVTGTLEHDAELRRTLRGPWLLLLEISTGRGMPYAAQLVIPDDPAATQAAEQQEHQLRRGTRVRVTAAGLRVRTDHDRATLVLMDARDVIHVTEEGAPPCKP